jgi:hypothetical protein
MYIKRLAEKSVHKALLVFEIKSFENHCRSDSESLSDLQWTTTGRQEYDSNMTGIWQEYDRQRTLGKYMIEDTIK